jgi:hypothetical protein
MTFKGRDFYQANEVEYMVEKGWLIAGVSAGTFKLTAEGQAHAQKLLEAEDFETRVFYKFLQNANAEADPKTF